MDIRIFLVFIENRMRENQNREITRRGLYLGKFERALDLFIFLWGQFIFINSINIYWENTICQARFVGTGIQQWGREKKCNTSFDVAYIPVEETDSTKINVSIVMYYEEKKRMGRK